MQPDWRRGAKVLAMVLACIAPAAALAQNTNWKEPEPWQESDTPLPTALRMDKLIAIQFPGSALRFGIDPESVQVGRDGAIRYVVVATSDSGAINAMQEGIRCDTFEVKTYARHYPGTGWTPMKQPTWQPLRGNGAHRHSLTIARNGLCTPDNATRNASQIVRDLR